MPSVGKLVLMCSSLEVYMEYTPAPHWLPRLRLLVLKDALSESLFVFIFQPFCGCQKYFWFALMLIYLYFFVVYFSLKNQN